MLLYDLEIFSRILCSIIVSSVPPLDLWPQCAAACQFDNGGDAGDD